MSDCRAAVCIDSSDTKYECELSAPHKGLAHVAQTPVGRIDWCSHGEAKVVKR
jgi:hypothetical protein